MLQACVCVCVCVPANSRLLLHTRCNEEVFAVWRADNEAAITCFWRPAGRGLCLGLGHIYTDTMGCVGGVWECGVCAGVWGMGGVRECGVCAGVLGMGGVWEVLVIYTSCYKRHE